MQQLFKRRKIMKTITKRYLALLMTIIMIFTVNPISTYAAEPTGTFVQISSIADLTSGKYVMVVNSGYAMGVFDDGTNKWITATTVTPTEGKVINPDRNQIWNITVTETGVKLTDSNGITVKPLGGDNNGIAAGDYTWVLAANSNIFNFKGISTDPVTLASNTGSQNKFRAYRDYTISKSVSSYPTGFTLYKLDASAPIVPVKTATPVANMPSGNVASGSAISLSCATSGASIQYTTATPSAIWVDYTSPIVISSNTTIYAQAITTESGYIESDIAEFNYIPVETPSVTPSVTPTVTPSVTPTVPVTPPGDLFDPIPSIPDGAKSVLEVSQMATGQAITVVGQIVYRFGNYNTATSTIIEDVINGEIYALQIYDTLSDFKIGDVVKLSGTTDNYGGVPQIKTLTAKELVTKAADTQLIKAQEFTSFSAILASKNSLLSEWVVIKDVTLDTYNSSGSTNVKDNNNNIMPIFRAATYPSGVVEGDKVNLYACVSVYNATDQLRVGSSSDYVITSDTKAPVITMPTFEQAEVGKDYKISVRITDNVAVLDADITYTINQTPTKIALVKNASDSTIWEATIPGTALTKGLSEFTVVVSARDTSGFEAKSDVVKIVVADEPQVTNVTPARGGKTGDEKKPVISVTASNLGTAPTAKLTLKAGDTVVLDAVAMTYAAGTFSYKPSVNLEDKQYSASVVITRNDNKTISCDWSFFVGNPKYDLYFGQLHSHTTYSDGSGSLDDALNYINNISDSDNVDFVAFTDHSNYFDTTKEANPEASLYDKNLMTTGSQKIWNEYKSKVAVFNASAQNKGVIALAGFEMTWSGGPGHINTWNTEGIVSRNNTTLNSKTSDAGLKAYYSLLSQNQGANSISEFNHPGSTFGTFSDFAYWDSVIDTRISLIEVGNGEGAIGSGGYFPSYSYYTMALDKGWHVAPTNNQDNHKGKWGNANDARDVIITDDFTEQGIYSALKDRRVYATEDKNLEITYTMNDNFMGTIIKEVPENLNIKLSLSDADDAIQKAEVIVNSGRVLYTWDVNAQSKELNVTLKPDYSYYYIRVTQKDGDLAVTAPIWVGNAKLLGISNVESSTATPVTEEKLTIKTTLFNSETSDANIKSLTYKLDGEVLGVKTDAGVVAKGTTVVDQYEFTPTKAKVQTLTVDAVLKIGDKEYTFTKGVSLDVRDVNKLVYIGIDGSHYNEYVAGNYKDSMGNFSSLAAKSNVRCVILKTSEELIAAAYNTNGKYKMIILTAPSRRNGIVLRNPYAVYNDAEIAAIKGFAEAGGSLVVCGWSDLYENYGAFAAEDHMAAQQNKLLTAIGATLRISDDGAYDDVLNAGGSEANKARLYLTTYNWENPLTKGIVYDKDHPNDNMYTQRFSQYGGATIYAVDQEDNPSTILPSTVSPIVYGHSSTYSKNCDNDGFGGDIPKYEYASGDNRLMVLASETVTHANGTKSLVIVDGAAFMSNFEIQATVSDTNAELNYSNFNILQNLIQFVNPVKIDSIADVQKQPEEGIKYTVEGIVTSNASGYDKNTAFFDCIYLQDGTAGINAFPVSGDYKVGQKVRITGTTSSYQGERQLNVSSISLVDSTVQTVVPKVVTAQQINDKTYLGSLVKLSGKIVKVELANGAVQTILVQDTEGKIARVFIDGYITTNKTINNLVVGNQITAVGLSSYDSAFPGLAARIRVRDRSDVICSVITPTPDTSSQTTITPTITPTPSKETVILTKEAESKIVNGKAKAIVEIGEDLLRDAANGGSAEVTLTIKKEVLQDVLTDKHVKKGVIIDLLIPAVSGIEVSKIEVDNDTLLLAKKAKQSVTFNVSNGDLKYTLNLPASELDKISSTSKGLNLAVSLERETNSILNIAGHLSIGSEGSLSAGMVLTLPVKNTLSLSNRKVYIYHRNDKTGVLEEIPNNEKVLGKDGILKISSLSGGDYVISTIEVEDAVPLIERVSVSAKAAVAKGDKLDIKVILPLELAPVVKYVYGDPIGQEEVILTYKVDNEEIATISRNGKLTAKKKGTVKITVTVTLENGDQKKFTKVVTVK
jgi:hypothetical protein